MHIITMIRANMKHKKGSFIGILILMFFVSAIMTLVLSTSYNGKKHVDDALDYANTGNLMLWFTKGTLTDEVSQIEKLSEIKKADTVEAVYTAEKNDVIVNGKKAELYAQFQVYDTKNHNYHVYNEKKTKFLPDQGKLSAGELYLPVALADKYDCNIGDEVKIATKSFQQSFHIKGFIEEPTMGNPVIGGYKNVFISQEDFDKLYEEYSKATGELICCEVVQVYVKDNCKLNDHELSSLLNETNHFVDKATNAVSRAEFASYSSIMLNIFISVLLVFGLILFLIVLIVVGHNITSSIEMDYKNLGILKAVGYCGGQLRFIYIVQYLLTAVLGSLAGFALGSVAVSTFNTVFVGITGLLIGDKIAVPMISLGIAIIWIFMVLFILVKTIKINRIRPLNAIVGMREVKRKPVKVRCGISKERLDLKMAIRQITSNFKQYISTLFIIALLIFFILCVEMILTCFEEGNILEEFYGFTFDIEIDYKNNLDLKEEVTKEIQKQSEISWNSEFFTDTFTVDGSAVLGNAVHDSERFTNIYKGTAPEKDNEVAVTEVFAEAFDVKVGDTIDVGYSEATKTFTITGLYQSVGKAGMQFSMLVSGLKALDKDVTLSIYDYALKDNKKSEKIVDDLKDKYGDKLEITTIKDVLGVMDTISSLSTLIVILVYGISILFIIAVISMVCRKLFTMEQHDYGIYKAIGFTSGRLRAQFSLRFVCIGLLGVVVGLVLSLSLNKVVLGIMLKSMGITNFNANYTVASIVIPVIVMCATLFICSYFASRRINKVNTKMLIVE